MRRRAPGRSGTITSRPAPARPLATGRRRGSSRPDSEKPGASTIAAREAPSPGRQRSAPCPRSRRGAGPSGASPRTARSSPTASRSSSAAQPGGSRSARTRRSGRPAIVRWRWPQPCPPGGQPSPRSGTRFRGAGHHPSGCVRQSNLGNGAPPQPDARRRVSGRLILARPAGPQTPRRPVRRADGALAAPAGQPPAASVVVR